MRTRLLAFALVFALALVSLSLGQPAPTAFAQGGMMRTECKEDLTGKTITLHTFGDLSGPFAPITQPLAAGFADALKYYNANGGICGAAITLQQDDTAGRQEQTQSLYQRYRAFDPKPLMLLLYSSADAELLREQVADDEIPVFLFAGSTIGLYGEQADTPGWIFAGIPLYTDQFGAFCRWLGKAWTTDLGREGSPKVGHLSWEGAFGRSSETAETTAYCAAQGVEVVGGEYFLPTATDVTAQINNLVSKGANVLFTTSLASGTALIAKDLVTLGLEEEVLLSGVNWALDSSVGLLGQATFKPSGLPSTDNIYGIMPYIWWDEPTDGTKLVQEQFTANQRPLTARGISYLAGFGAIDTYIELITQTVNRVGYDNLSGAEVKKTFETFKYDALGGVFKYNFAENVRAQNSARIGRLTYARGADGMPIVVEVGGNKLLVPVVLPVTTEFETVPDLKPGGADVVN
ncbi:MAG: ABC transporter substrate-binding protein [Chloroflexi bacterium CFX4]|nr:ABC transporter substrate-binding protein [Chloroflexi bacterium CFX4]MDL1922512.1 ABC transporter substrate-binding protein [Chloroflexi bacterium CFX3]